MSDSRRPSCLRPRWFLRNGPVWRNEFARDDRPPHIWNEPLRVKAANAIFERVHIRAPADILLGLLNRLELVVDVRSETRFGRRNAVAEGVTGESVLPSGSAPLTAQLP